MKLIIDIPEKAKQAFDNARDEDLYGSYYDYNSLIGKAIKNGIPLPKGHGRLKDTDAICKDIISALGIRDENYLLEAEEAVYKRIKDAPTIIEADTESEN